MYNRIESLGKERFFKELKNPKSIVYACTIEWAKCNKITFAQRKSSTVTQSCIIAEQNQEAIIEMLETYTQHPKGTVENWLIEAYKTVITDVDKVAEPPVRYDWIPDAKIVKI